MLQHLASQQATTSHYPQQQGQDEGPIKSLDRLVPEKCIGPEFYFIGVIDILQTWTFQKQLERFSKTSFRGADPQGLSAIPPREYRARFLKKMNFVFGAGDDSEDVVFPLMKKKE